MWRTMHKLTRTFSDQPQPKRSAELYKMKLNEFKEHLPLLQTFCNQGLRDRHWQRVSQSVSHSAREIHTLTLELADERYSWI